MCRSFHRFRNRSACVPFPEPGGPNRTRFILAPPTAQTPVLLAQMRTAIETADAEALYQGAHKMKGSVSNFEGDPSVDLSVMIETAARDNDFQRAATLLRRLESAVSALERRIGAAVVTTV